MRPGRRLSAWIAGVGLAVVGLALPAVASAAEFDVTTTVDERIEDETMGTGCSLREAVEAANTDGVYGGCTEVDSGPDIINLNHPSYTLTRDGPLDNDNTNGDLDIRDDGGDGTNEDLLIGPSIPLLISTGYPTISGSPDAAPADDDRVLEVHAPPPADSINLTAGGLVLTGGRTPADGGAVNLNGVAIGGPVSASFGLTTFTGNATSGSGSGGALGNDHGSLFVEESTISGNSATGNGGGIHQSTVGGAASTQLENVTIAGNVADSDNAGGGDGGGVAATSPGTVTFYNTLVGGNLDLGSTGTVSPDCAALAGATLDSVNNNLIGSTAGCGIDVGAGDVRDAAPGVAPLALIPYGSGGKTVLAHDLLPTSPARDAGAPVGSGLGNCSMLAQNFGPRPINGRCDIGSVEAALVPPPAPQPAGRKCKKGFRLKTIKKKGKKKRKKKCVRKKRKKKKK